MTLTEEYVETRVSDTPRDATHIVMVPPGEHDSTPQAYVLRARIEGFPVTAICGYIWVPERDPGVLPVCSTCLHVYQTQGSDLDQRGELPDA